MSESKRYSRPFALRMVPPTEEARMKGSRRARPPSLAGQRAHLAQQPLHRESAKLPPLEESEANTLTPPGSPRGFFQRDTSERDLMRSARSAFGGSLQPEEGEIAVLEYPVRKRPSTMVVAQDWDTREGEVIPPTSSTAAAIQMPTPPVNREVSLGKQEKGKAQSGLASSVSAAATIAGAETEISVVASAPGKIFVFGEHAIVYGKTAVAAAVSDLRVVTTARCTAEASLVVELPDLDVCFRRTADEVATYFDCVLKLSESAPETAHAPPAPAHVNLISMFIGYDWAEEKRRAILPLVFLAVAIVPGIFLARSGPAARGLSITVLAASLPVGAGLGSSAALCVATSAALTRLSSLLFEGNGERIGNEKPRALPGSTGVTERGETNAVAASVSVASTDGTGPRRFSRPSPSELELINAWAFAGETVLHDTVSGLDNTVSCYGGAIKFVKGMNGAGNVTKPIPSFPTLPILLTDTRVVAKDTRALEAEVRRLLEAYPRPTINTFDAIESIASELLERADSSAKRGGAPAPVPAKGVLEVGGEVGALTAECIGELAEMNHRLLCVLGIGHSALERVCEVARAQGCKSTLTGSGDGGCVLTILPGNDIISSTDSLVRDIRSEGFECYESSLGGAGVLWHDEGVPLELKAALTGTERVKLGERVKTGVHEKLWRNAVLAIIVAAAAVAVTVKMASSRCR